MKLLENKNLHQAIPLNVSNFEQQMKAVTNVHEPVYFQLIDRLTNKMFFAKAFNPPDGWKFYWTTDKNRPKFVYGVYHKEGNIYMKDVGMAKVSPFLKPV